MEIIDYNDFYIDLDGDIKVSFSENVAKFITNVSKNDKLNSEYFLAKNPNEILDKVKSINPSVDYDSVGLFKQYSLKFDNNNELKSIKIYYDYNWLADSLTYLLLGYNVSENNIESEFYFTGEIEVVKNFIIKNNINYEIIDYETHKPILFSVKKNDSGVVGFKTYYMRNSHEIHKTPNLIETIKKESIF